MTIVDLNFPSTSCIICYRATQIVENDLYSPAVFDLLLSIVEMISLRFLLLRLLPRTFPFHSILQHHLGYQLRLLVLFLPWLVTQGHLHILRYELLVFLF